MNSTTVQVAADYPKINAQASLFAGFPVTLRTVTVELPYEHLTLGFFSEAQGTWVWFTVTLNDILREFGAMPF